jgi:hypothetical protein
MDRKNDIINGKLKTGERAPFSAKNGKSMQFKLLKILEFFAKWRAAND